jgi:hypothetical protein
MMSHLHCVIPVKAIKAIATANQSREGFIRSLGLDEFLLCSAVSKHLGHFPEGLIEFHILIDALDCPALGHPATIRAAEGTVALTAANDVFLNMFARTLASALRERLISTPSSRIWNERARPR